MDAYKIAVLLFWLSFFANQRGIDKAARTGILAQLSTMMSPDTLKWFHQNYAACAAVWHAVHDNNVKAFVSLVEEKCHQWLDTPASSRFDELMKAARYFLNHSDRRH